MKMHNLGSDLFASALWIALPMVGMLMFVNLALGIVSRVAPQMNIFAVGFPVTLTVGLIGIAATLPMLDQPFMALMERAIDIFPAMIVLAGWCLRPTRCGWRRPSVRHCWRV